MKTDWIFTKFVAIEQPHRFTLLFLMKRRIHIIALRTIRHTDRSSILTAYSLEAGRIAFAVPAGAGREAARRRALLMPLSVVECVADLRPGRDIHIMQEPRAVMPLTALRSSPVKSAISLFIAELLGAALRDGPPDEMLYNYLAQAITILESLPTRGIANYHIWFLFGLGHFLGIEPDTTDYKPGMVFDMLDGIFRQTPPLHRHYLPATEAAIVASLSRMTPANMHLYRMSRSQRNELLDGILQYYSLHHVGLSSIRGLDILRDLFS